MGARLVIVAACALPAIATAGPKPKAASAKAAPTKTTPAKAKAAPKGDPLKPPSDPTPKGPSSRQRAQAKQHYTKALALFKKQKYDAARDELELALKIAPDADLHYALAQVDVELDRCDEVITEYQAFLETPHGEAATKVANDGIATCKAKLAPPPPPPPPPAPPKVAAPVAPSHPWYKDRVTDGLLGAGVVSGIISLLCYRSALGDLDAADKAMTLPEHAKLVDDAHSARTYAFVFAGTGLAFVTAGVVRYMTHDRTERRSVALVPTSGGGMLTISGSFQ